MSGTEQLGCITVRIPILAVTESESWEMPEPYNYLGTLPRAVA